MALSAHHEAVTHLTRALTLLPLLPETIERDRQELQLQTDLGVCYKITKGFAAPEVEQVYLRARELCESVGDPIAWACVLWGLHSVYIVRGAIAATRQPAQACMALVTKEPVLHVTGNCMLGCTESTAGELRSARSHFEQAVGLYTEEQHDTHIFLSGLDLGVFARVHLAHTLCYLGYPDQALEIAQEAVDLARTLLHPFSHISALSYLSMLHQLRGDTHAMQETTATAHRLCVEHDIPYYLAWTTFLQGWAMAENGHVNQAMSQMEQSLADLQAMQAGLRRPYYLGLLAEAYGTAGRIEDGLSLLTDAIAIAAEQEQNLYEPDLHRVRGELLWKRNSPYDAIEACFRQAIDVARQQEAKLMELRATTSLAQLLDHQGNGAEARRVLTGVVEWFREGYATADLRKAQATLHTIM